MASGNRRRLRHARQARSTGRRRSHGGWLPRRPALTDLELDLLTTLISARLAASVTLSTYQQTLHPDDAYLVVSQQPAWALLGKLAAIPPTLARAVFRHACGLEPMVEKRPFPLSPL
ncbi:MAG: hypothetical protein M5U34_26530 [Chloroflexi bacterium]|nr:hypothetical protein [Chloroflexota bacterium]